MPTSDDTEIRCPLGHRLSEGSLQADRHPTSVTFCPTCNANYSQQPDGTLIQISNRSRH
jgi:hypothetical protein